MPCPSPAVVLVSAEKGAAREIVAISAMQWLYIVAAVAAACLGVRWLVLRSRPYRGARAGRAGSRRTRLTRAEAEARRALDLRLKEIELERERRAQRHTGQTRF